MKNIVRDPSTINWGRKKERTEDANSAIDVIVKNVNMKKDIKMLSLPGNEWYNERRIYDYFEGDEIIFLGAENQYNTGIRLFFPKTESSV